MWLNKKIFRMCKLYQPRNYSPIAYNLKIISHGRQVLEVQRVPETVCRLRELKTILRLSVIQSIDRSLGNPQLTFTEPEVQALCSIYRFVKIKIGLTNSALNSEIISADLRASLFCKARYYVTGSDSVYAPPRLGSMN